MLDRQVPVWELVLEHAAVASVLRRHDIDYCCHGETSLAEACAARNLSLDVLLRELELAVAEEKDPEPLDPRSLDTRALIERIVIRHHGYLREALPFSMELATIVAFVHASKDGRLAEVLAVLSDLRDLVFVHIDHEERVLFPALRAPRRRARLIERELSMMTREHRELALLLRRLRALTDGFEPPEDTCSTHAALLAELRAIEADIFDHVHLEAHALAPRFSTQ